MFLAPPQGPQSQGVMLRVRRALNKPNLPWQLRYTGQPEIGKYLLLIILLENILESRHFTLTLAKHKFNYFITSFHSEVQLHLTSFILYCILYLYTPTLCTILLFFTYYYIPSTYLFFNHLQCLKFWTAPKTSTFV